MLENVLFVCNGPGEIHSLLRPLALAFRARFPTVRLHLVLTPSQFASGYEEQMARALGCLDSIEPVSRFWQWVRHPKLLKSQWPGGGLVFAVGGDLWHTRLLNRALRWPQYAYLETPQWGGGFKKVFDAAQGNLMADLPRVTDAQFQNALESHTLGFYVGSRQAFMRRLVPFYQQVILKLKLVDPQLRVLFWVPEHLQEEFRLQFPETPMLGSVEEAALMVTIVGTNTAVLTAKQVPMLVWLPLNWPEAIPAGGLLDMPWLKKVLLPWVVRRRSKKWALPNLLSQRAVVPELARALTPAEMAGQVQGLWQNPQALKDMHRALENVLGEPGVAQRIVNQLWN